MMSKSRGCAVLNCPNTLKDTSLYCFPLPTNSVRFKEWVIATGNPAFLGQNPDSIRRGRFKVCKAHFTVDHFHFTRLNQLAIPTLNLPEPLILPLTWGEPEKDDEQTTVSEIWPDTYTTIFSNKDDSPRELIASPVVASRSKVVRVFYREQDIPLGSDIGELSDAPVCEFTHLKECPVTYADKSVQLITEWDNNQKFHSLALSLIF